MSQYSHGVVCPCTLLLESTEVTQPQYCWILYAHQPRCCGVSCNPRVHSNVSHRGLLVPAYLLKICAAMAQVIETSFPTQVPHQAPLERYTTSGGNVVSWVNHINSATKVLSFSLQLPVTIRPSPSRAYEVSRILYASAGNTSIPPHFVLLIHTVSPFSTFCKCSIWLYHGYGPVFRCCHVYL